MDTEELAEVFGDDDLDKTLARVVGTGSAVGLEGEGPFTVRNALLFDFFLG